MLATQLDAKIKKLPLKNVFFASPRPNWLACHPVVTSSEEPTFAGILVRPSNNDRGFNEAPDHQEDDENIGWDQPLHDGVAADDDVAVVDPLRVVLRRLKKSSAKKNISTGCRFFVFSRKETVFDRKIMRCVGSTN